MEQLLLMIMYQATRIPTLTVPLLFLLRNCINQLPTLSNGLAWMKV